uniref:Nuclear receptor domain-containing protein n=1 Tax=Meloidogyne hapla TaxID=6305 RepID=A0A1I8BZ30_MELHA
MSLNRPTCRNCGREHGRKYNYRYQCPRCHHYQDSTGMRRRKNSSSSLCSLATHHENTDLTQTRLRHRPPMPLPPQTHWSDHESDYWPPMTNSEHNYTNINTKDRIQSLAPPIMPRRRKKVESEISSLARPQKPLEVPQGISIPQHIIIPPIPNDGTLDSQAERQYRINSEIVISYDQPPRQDISSRTFQSPPQQNKNNNQISKQKLPVPLERRSLKSTISPTQLPMALTSTV